MYKNSFKDMLKYYRERNNLSQRELAKILGLGASTIAMYERGAREPSFEIEERIADFFNVDIATLRGVAASDMYINDADLKTIIEIYRGLGHNASKALLTYAKFLKNCEQKEEGLNGKG